MGLIRRHPAVTTLVVVAVLVAVGVTVVVVSIDEPGPASIDDAVDRFEDERTGGRSGGRPPEGVYLYTGAGEERLSFPPLDQADSTDMPATVVHQGRDCWVFRIDFNAAHWQDWTWCRRDGSVVETGGRSGQTWDLGVNSVSNVSDFACDPPNPVLVEGAEPGDVVRQSCVGSNTSIAGATNSAGPSTFVGVEEVEVGGDVVEARHLSGRRRLSGGQEGTEVTEAWFGADGRLLRYERDIEVRTDSPVGTITYTESGHFALTDLAPRG